MCVEYKPVCKIRTWAGHGNLTDLAEIQHVTFRAQKRFLKFNRFQFGVEILVRKPVQSVSSI